MLEAGVGAVRVVRALGFLTAIVWLTAAGHILGGGAASPAGVAALAFLAWPAALAGSRRRRRLRHLLPALGIGQFAGHGVLDFFSAAGAAPGPCAVSGAHHALHVGCAPGVAGDTPMASMGLSMAAAHVLAALVLAVLISRGEAALWRVVDLVMPCPPRLVPLRPSRRTGHVAVALRPLPRLGIAVPARGPPVAI